MKAFRRSAFVSTAATYGLIFVGGLVRVSGAGLGCPDWPRCFGRWFPPTSAAQLPPDIDPHLFNITLAWVEYINRLFGVLAGVLILTTAVLALTYHRRNPKILSFSLAALVLVAFQGWMGGKVVGSELEPVLITIHMLLAVVLVSVLIFTTQQAYYAEYPGLDRETVYPAHAVAWVSVLGGASLVQIVLGTQIRSTLEVLRGRFPVLSGRELIDMVGAEQNVHWILGIVMLFVSLHVGVKILIYSKQPPALARQGAWGLIALIAVQIISGILFVQFGLPKLAQLFHLWFASLYFGAVVILFTAVRRKPGGEHAVE